MQEIISSPANAQSFTNLRFIRGFILSYGFLSTFVSNSVVEAEFVLERLRDQRLTVEAFHKGVLLIIGRMPNLERLVTFCDSPLAELQEEAALWISRLPLLMCPRLPVFCLATTISRLAARLRRLETPGFRRKDLQSEGNNGATYFCMLSGDVDPTLHFDMYDLPPSIRMFRLPQCDNIVVST